MADPETVDVYNARAEEYAARFGAAPDRHLTAFADRLAPGANVLDLGCGTGNAAAVLAHSGFTVSAWDASAEMVALAKKTYGLDAEMRAFDSLDLVDHFDAIWANFSLLHARKADMPDHLSRIARALKPGGLFHIGLKTGEGERRDGLGRFYAYYTDAEITALLTDAGLHPITRSFGTEAGLDGTLAPWIVLLAEAKDA